MYRKSQKTSPKTEKQDRATDVSPVTTFCIPVFFIIVLLFIPPVLAGTETLISVNTSSSSQYDPAIYGNWIVWTDARLGTSQVYAYNIESGRETRISLPGSIASQPSIYQDRVVWNDRRFGNSDIFLYNLTTGIESQITSEIHNQELPDIYGHRIVWQDDRAETSSYDVYLYDLLTSSENSLTPDTPDSDQINPDIYGSNVVWQDKRNYNDAMMDYYYDIFLMDAATGFLLNATEGIADTDEFTPAISGNIVVWTDERNGEKADIYMNNTVTGSQDPVNENVPAYRIFPAIDGSNVTWLDNRNRVGTNYDIYYKDISTIPGNDIRITSPVSAIVTSGKGPKINNNRIVWTDRRNGNNDIFMYTIGPDQTCPVASFTISPSQSGTLPHAVQFTDTTSAGTTAVSHYKWEFGDGNTSDEQNPLFTYRIPGNYNARLTVNNAYCRNETPVLDRYLINVGAAPVAAFTPNVTSGMIPLPVKFTDSSSGATVWNWSFGDGSYSVLQSPTHNYADGGTYTVVLNASNSYGYSLKQATVQALTGANEDADATIDGIAITTPYSTQFLTYDTAKLPGPVNLGPILICTSPQLTAHGLQNITFESGDGVGFWSDGTLIKGNISNVTILTKNIRPAGFSKSVGDPVSVNYSISLTSYPVGGTLNTQIWEGSTAADYSAFDTIAHSSGYSEIWGIAYTTKITRTNFPDGGTAHLNLDVNSSWVAGLNGRSHTFVERISNDRSTGEVLPVQFLPSDSTANVDRFGVDSPRGSSTFALVQLSGSGNPFQLITLSILGQLDPGVYLSGSTDSGTGAGAQSPGYGQPSPGAQAHEMKAPVFVDPGVSEKVFTNREGLTTQPLTLVSTDKLVSITVQKDVVALDGAGKPLTSITLSAIPADAVASTPEGQVFSFAGVAYEMQPDGATFSPEITLSFILPQAMWGQNYVIQRYDRTNGRWEEIPSAYDPRTGTLSGKTDHFCTFAVFTKSVPADKTPTPVPNAPPLKAPVAESPASAVSIFLNMIAWLSTILVNNILIVIIIGVGCIGYYWLRLR
jgi:beta propeller repeat protein